MFLTEVVMYTLVIPRLRELDPRIAAPRTFYADDGQGVMVMENLKTRGYTIPDRIKGDEPGTYVYTRPTTQGTWTDQKKKKNHTSNASKVQKFVGVGRAYLSLETPRLTFCLPSCFVGQTRVDDLLL